MTKGGTASGVSAFCPPDITARDEISQTFPPLYLHTGSDQIPTSKLLAEYDRVTKHNILPMSMVNLAVTQL